MPRSLVTLWAETWLQTVEEKTGRKPFLYSYAQFLEMAMARSDLVFRMGHVMRVDSKLKKRKSRRKLNVK